MSTAVLRNEPNTDVASVDWFYPFCRAETLRTNVWPAEPVCEASSVMTLSGALGIHMAQELQKQKFRSRAGREAMKAEPFNLKDLDGGKVLSQMEASEAPIAEQSEPTTSEEGGISGDQTTSEEETVSEEETCVDQEDKELSGRFSACIVGAGAIGSHIAYTLHRAGADVTLIARGENLRVLRTEGLKMTILGEEAEPVFIRATDRPEEVGPVDYVFLTMKVSGYDSAITNVVKPLIGPNTTILPPTTSIPYWWFHDFRGEWEGRRLDRVDPDGKLWEALPPAQVVGYTMWLSAVQTGPGQVTLRHVQRGYPLGELDGSESKRVERLARAIERGGIPSPRVPNIRSEIFIKSINSLAFNLVAVLGNATNGVIADAPEAVDTLRQVMAECEAIAGAFGIPILQSAEDRIRQTLSARMHTMSMLHDFRSGRKLELQPLWESVKDLAAVAGVGLPVTQALVGVAILRQAAEVEASRKKLEQQ